MVTATVAASLSGKPHALALFVQLALYADYETKSCFPSLTTLMKDTGLSKNTVLKAIKELEAAGLLRKGVRTDPQHANTYTVMEIPSKVASSRDEPGVVHNMNQASSRDEHQQEPYNDNHNNENKNLPVIPPPMEAKVATNKDLAQRVINRLNKSCDKNFRAAEGTLKPILMRLKTHPVTDLELVVDYKAAEWLNDPKMRQFLQPSTLFRPSKFDEYLDCAKQWDIEGRPNKQNGAIKGTGLVQSMEQYLGGN